MKTNKILQSKFMSPLQETCVGGNTNPPGWGNCVDPLDQYRDPITGMLWRPLGAGSSWEHHSQDISDVRDIARLLLEKNTQAISVMDTLLSFILGEGLTFTVTPDKKVGQEASDDLIAACQDVIDEFLEVNLFDELASELVTRHRRDGEYFVREFVSDSQLLLRTVDPEHVCPPDGASAELYPSGIEYHPSDHQHVLGYWIRQPGFEGYVAAEHMHHAKANVDRCVLRGISDFYPVADDSTGAQTLLRNMQKGGAIQAAIAWIEEFDSASGASISNSIQQARSHVQMDPFTGKNVSFQEFAPGTVVKVTKGRTYVPAPLAANTTQHLEIYKACLRNVLVRWGMPEYFGGDASNANFASTLVSGSPFVRRIRRAQKYYRVRFVKFAWKALQIAAQAGRLPWRWSEIERQVDIQCEAPTPELADALQQAQVRQIEHAAGVVSTKTWRQRSGYDSETEEQNIATQPPAPTGTGLGLLSLGESRPFFPRVRQRPG